MTKRRRKSIVRGNTIYVLGSPPPRWQPVIDKSVPVDDVRGKRAPEADGEYLPDEICYPDEVGDVAAVVAILDAVLGDVGDDNGVVGDDVGDATAATDEVGPAPVGDTSISSDGTDGSAAPQGEDDHEHE
ncbi:MAG: hypothetical protein JWP01_3956 [Myxococcales bacterium]|nr:hypothetical protein [Myxococcales bacterium]